MPIYEYSCEKCQKVFEELTRRIDDNVSQTCPECGGNAHRIVSNTSFVLKGGGWYVTEYGNRKGASEGGSPASTSSSSSSASAGSAVSTSAPAAKSEAQASSGSSDSSASSSSPATPASSASSGASASAASSGAAS